MLELPLGLAGPRPVHPVLHFDQDKAVILEPQNPIDEKILAPEDLGNFQVAATAEEEIEKRVLESVGRRRPWPEGRAEAGYSRRARRFYAGINRSVDDTRKAYDR